MHLRVQRFTDLPSRSEELDQGLVPGDAGDREAVRLEPRGHNLGVFIQCTESRPILIGGEPLVIGRRTGRMYVLKKLLQVFLAIGRRFTVSSRRCIGKLSEILPGRMG